MKWNDVKHILIIVALLLGAILIHIVFGAKKHSHKGYR